MASITSLGSGSNLDLEGLLTKLVSAEKDPQQAQIDSSKALVTATISALGSLKSKLSAFQTAQTKLKDASFFTAKTATSADKSLFTVSATGTAAAGSYNVGVLNLATANKIALGEFANPAAAVGNGKLTIGVGSNSFDVTIAAGENDTLQGIANSINNAATNSGVKASILTVSNADFTGTVSKLVLTANNTGASSQISVTVVDGEAASPDTSADTNTDNTGLSQLYYSNTDPVKKLSQINPAQDAKITVDGFAATSANNVFSGVIEGVTITAIKGDPLNPPSAALTVAADTASVQTAVQAFVTSYNDLANAFSSLTTYNKDTGSGALSADSSLLAIRSKIKQIIANPVTGASNDFNTLAFLGISTNKDGTLTSDSGKLSTALTNRPGDVAKLFSGSDGVAGKFDTLLGNLVSSSGIFQTRTDALNTQLSKLSDQQSALDLRIESFTTRYRTQFTALDTLVNQLNSTGSFLTQQLTATAQIINHKNN